MPHQANKLYFNIETVGNTSAASIPLALADAIAEGVLKEPVRVFTPGYGAGAVGGYAVLRVDPAIIADELTSTEPTGSGTEDLGPTLTSSDNVRVAFS